MEKQQSRPSATRLPQLNDIYRIPAYHSAKNDGARDKPSRDEISRCINIWAAVYRLRDADLAELCMSRTIWGGRDPSYTERFD